MRCRKDATYPHERTTAATGLSSALARPPDMSCPVILPVSLAAAEHITCRPSLQPASSTLCCRVVGNELTPSNRSVPCLACLTVERGHGLVPIVLIAIGRNLVCLDEESPGLHQVHKLALALQVTLALSAGILVHVPRLVRTTWDNLLLHVRDQWLLLQSLAKFGMWACSIQKQW